MLSSVDKRGGVLDADVRIFGTKNLEFFKIYGVSARTRVEKG